MQLICPICRRTLPVRTADVTGNVMVVPAAFDTIALTVRCRHCRNVVGFTARELGWRACTGACLPVDAPVGAPADAPLAGVAAVT